jgi:capsid protein
MVIAAAVTEPGGRIDKRGGYRAGQSDRRQTRNWRALPKSANSDTLGRQREMIGRSRDAAMNLAPATAAIERNVTFAIGSGLMAIPDLDAEVLGITPQEKAAWTARIRRDYDLYMASTDPDAERAVTGYGQQAVVLRAVFESGDVLGLRCWPDEQIGRVHMTAWKLVEADRIVSPFSHTEGERHGGQSGPVVVGGVELDSYGAARAFHVLQKAPGAYTTARRADDTKRYPAWGQETQLRNAVLVFDKRRPEQVRGVPLLAPVLELVRIFADVTDAAAMSLLLQSMLAVIYKSPDATAMPEPEYGAGELVQSEGVPQTMGDATGGKGIAFEAGMVLELDSDSEIDLKSPGKDNPAYEKFFESVLTLVGAATGTPFGVLMARFNNSYTASKGEMELFYKTVTQRVEAFTGNWCTPHYHAWLYERVARGIYGLPGFLDDLAMREAWCSARWAGDGKISLDPLRERKAFEIDEAHAWQTGAQIAAQINGGDYDANVVQRGTEHRDFVGAGLPLPNQNGGGVARGSGAAPDQKDEES